MKFDREALLAKIAATNKQRELEVIKQLAELYNKYGYNKG